MKKTLFAILVATSLHVQADRMVSILEIDDNPLSPKQIAEQVDPRNIKAVKQKKLLADGLFEFNKYDVKKLRKNDEIFKEIAMEAKENGYTIRIDAFADELGTDKYNQKLSDRRAKSVANYLNVHYGVPLDQMTYQGWGENYPVVSCQISKKLLRDKVSKAQIIECLSPNRRVTLSLLN